MPFKFNTWKPTADFGGERDRERERNSDHTRVQAAPVKKGGRIIVNEVSQPFILAS